MEAVHAWQRHYGMEPRSDSKLTQLYASGALPASVAELSASVRRLLHLAAAELNLDRVE